MTHMVSIRRVRLSILNTYIDDKTPIFFSFFFFFFRKKPNKLRAYFVYVQFFKTSYFVYVQLFKTSSFFF